MAPSNDTPLSLLERIREGEESTAWREFDAIYRPILRRYAHVWRLPVADAEDVVQHAMAAIHANIRQFTHNREVGQFRAWLRTLVNNHIKNLLSKRRPELLKSELALGHEAREEPPDEAFARIWLHEHLRFYLEQIKSESRPQVFEAFQSHVLRQESVEAVCQEFCLTPNQLYKLKWNVTQKLRDKMHGLLDDE
jgi:RNA polymerase sigma-70 factor (ECF subfamily)